MPPTSAPGVLINPPDHLLGHHNAIVSGRVPDTNPDPDFQGPLSIKFMATGAGQWRTAEGTFRVAPGRFVVLNDGQRYSLRMLEADSISFCVFFARGFVEDAYASLTRSDSDLVDGPECARSGGPGFFEHLQANDRWVDPQLRRLCRHFNSAERDLVYLDEQFWVLAEGLLRSRSDLWRRVADVPATRAATRQELFHRVHRAHDYLHDRFDRPLSVGTLARVACLSPHHFHRVFRSVFGRTPHQAVTRVRIERARHLLDHSSRSVTEICQAVGFESLGAFSSRFRRNVGVSPSGYRQRAN